MTWVVTIDGPAGAGKSAVAKGLAARLGWSLLDTGAMYRAVALAALRGEVDLQSDSALGDLVARIEVVVTADEVRLNGQDVTSAIREQEVTRQTRHVADCPSVRRRLVDWQRAFANSARWVVAEGRDQGTIVFPDALRKFFLTAQDEERARRRQREQEARGCFESLEETLQQVRARDQTDRDRAIAPMIAARDARLVDSTGLSLDSVIDLLERDVRDHLGPDVGQDGATLVAQSADHDGC